MKPVILISYIMITNNYVQHDINMQILPVFLFFFCFFFADSNSSVHTPYIIHVDKYCTSIYLLSKHCLIKFLVLYSINSTIGVILNAFNKSDILARNDILKIYLNIFL